MLIYAQNPLDTFSRSFAVDAEVADLLLTCYGFDSDTSNYLDMSSCR